MTLNHIVGNLILLPEIYPRRYSHRTSKSSHKLSKSPVYQKRICPWSKKCEKKYWKTKTSLNVTLNSCYEVPQDHSELSYTWKRAKSRAKLNRSMRQRFLNHFLNYSKLVCTLGRKEFNVEIVNLSHRVRWLLVMNFWKLCCTHSYLRANRVQLQDNPSVVRYSRSEFPKTTISSRRWMHFNCDPDRAAWINEPVFKNRFFNTLLLFHIHVSTVNVFSMR